MPNIAYIRVSATDQNTDRQLADASITFDKTFEDKTSGKNTDRPALTQCLDYVREGDTLWIHSIDRFARSLQDLQHLVDQLMAKGVEVRFYKEQLTFAQGKDQNAYNKLMFQMLGAFAEFERNIIRERQREGIAKAKAAGKYNHGKGGRKQTIDREQIAALKAEGMPLRKIAERLGCSLSSVQRALGDKE